VLTHFHLIRKVVLALAVAVVSMGIPNLAAARFTITQTVILTAFYGQVTNIVGPADAPTGFTLLLNNRLVDFRVAPHATFKPLSAEAEVEGFQPNDYAAVGARRINHAWVALGIQFDVQPFRGVVTITGVIARVTPNGLRFDLQLDNGTSRWVTITPKTTFQIDGRLQAVPPLLQKGEMASVRMRPSPRGWLALQIDLKSNPTPLRALI
jgi:hypothetical protein